MSCTSYSLFLKIENSKVYRFLDVDYHIEIRLS